MIVLDHYHRGLLEGVEEEFRQVYCCKAFGEEKKVMGLSILRSILFGIEVILRFLILGMIGFLLSFFGIGLSECSAGYCVKLGNFVISWKTKR